MKRKAATYAQVSETIGAHITRDELLRALAAGDEAVSMSSFSGLELAGVDAGDTTFDELVFRDCTFEDIDFSRSTFANVRFIGCRFITCTMSRCWLNRVDFCGCSAPGLSVLKSRLTGVSLSDCQLRYADFSEATIKGLRASFTVLAESSWHASNLSDARFAGCDLTRAEFFRTRLAGIDLSTCEIAGLVLSSDFHELRGCIIDPEQAVDLVGMLGVKIKE